LTNDLRFVTITSQAVVTEAARGGDCEVFVVPSPHRKCERCWHYRADVGHDATHPRICGRCTANLFGKGEPRVVA
jgi:isoleucyl-tRNA synthetase